jgi:hypothetical protein
MKKTKPSPAVWFSAIKVSHPAGNCRLVFGSWDLDLLHNSLPINHIRGQFPLIPAPHFATTIREANVTFGATNWWRAWEASPNITFGETDLWRAWEAKFPLGI